MRASSTATVELVGVKSYKVFNRGWPKAVQEPVMQAGLLKVSRTRTHGGLLQCSAKGVKGAPLRGHFVCI